MSQLACPVCARHGWMTADGLAFHLVRDHTAQVVAETLAELVVGKAPKQQGCRKLGYPTEHAARIELVGTVVGRNRGKQQRKECRAYLCPRCEQWHLTSQPERKSA